MRRLFAVLCVLGLVGCAADPQAPTGQGAAATTLQRSDVVGTWRGQWDNNPGFSSAVTIRDLSQTGDLIGVYIFQTQSFPFRSRLDGSTFRVQGMSMVFQPDGTIRGTRFWERGTNQIVMRRE